MNDALAALSRAEVGISGPAQLDETVTLSTLIDAYIMNYAGRDTALAHRLGWWRTRLGDRVVATITDEDVFQALETYASAPARVYAGRDADGNRIFRSKGRLPSTNSVNRHHSALSAVIRWAHRRRILPRSYHNPARLVDRRPEAQGRIRFLSEDERARLLEACRASRWPRLYLLVLMAITTGARRGELLSLTWGDIDFGRQVAYVGTSKNGEPRVLPLTAAVIEELTPIALKRRDALIFPSKRNPRKPYSVNCFWLPAIAAAGIRNFRFHDLRHTCASYLAQNGATLLEIADVLGHKDLKMTKRYSHLTVDSKAAVVNRVLGDIR